jgi:hypothetical protein
MGPLTEDELRSRAYFEEYLVALNPPRARLFEAVADLLRQGGYEHAVIGGHAYNAHMPAQERATVDFDLIVPTHRVHELAHKIRSLVSERATVEPTSAFWAVKDGATRLVDLALAGAHPLFERTLKDAIELEVPTCGRLRVARKETIIALKVFASTDTSKGRSLAKRRRDEVDAMDLLASGIDERYLLEVGAELLPEPAFERLKQLRTELE